MAWETSNKTPPHPGETWGYKETYMIIETGEFNDEKTGINITVTYPNSMNWPEFRKLQCLDEGLLPASWHILTDNEAKKLRVAIITDRR